MTPAQSAPLIDDMSTGADCAFHHYTSGWYYELEHFVLGEDDERDESSAEMVLYGPFSSFAAGEAHLSRWHANPGGFSAPAPDAAPVAETPEVSAWLRSARR